VKAKAVVAPVAPEVKADPLEALKGLFNFGKKDQK
jgi:hypothetical protein